MFEWARSANPSQPITSGWWNGGVEFDPINEFILTESDVVTFHAYCDVECTETTINKLRSNSFNIKNTTDPSSALNIWHVLWVRHLSHICPYSKVKVCGLSIGASCLAELKLIILGGRSQATQFLKNGFTTSSNPMALLSASQKPSSSKISQSYHAHIYHSFDTLIRIHAHFIIY